ncbi:sn-glycerol-3-phosphate ABC transporter ATP-binding protein UgpC [Mycoplasmatota bacterium WC44]
MATLKLKNIDKVYPNGVQAVFDFNLEVKDREFIVFVGPSGCGKSTTLRMIAGLEEITSGELEINEKLVNNVAPKDRDIAMVFQNYALYPHMSVFDNMAFGLKLRKMDKEVIKQKVNDAAKILGLTEYLDRKPKALSGGQRQRVALGRAIVRDAKVFLMDEPLSNLDAKLRVQMRAEIGRLHSQLETTTIYVTHDQIEAMTMATRIVVMKDGYIQQVGAPKEIYDFPANVFVGSFIGTPPMNFIKGKLDGNQFTCKDLKLTVPAPKISELERLGYANKEVILGIRPEHVYDTDSNTQKAKVKVDLVELVGSESVVYMTVADTPLIAKVGVRTDIHIGDEMNFSFDLEKAHFFDAKTEERIKIAK